MERYSETKAMEGVPLDPVEEWVAPVGETGLEEPLWQLGLGGYSQAYPERPDEPDCLYYLKTGFCGYGNRCRFNHPPDRSMVMGDFRSGGMYPERTGQPVCQYYMKTGTCKFGASCKYHHPKHSASPVTLNICGYPLRPGEKECSYYIKTGICKFGVTCKFHHPQPSGMHFPAPEQGPGPIGTPTAFAPPTIFHAVQGPSVQTSQQYGVIQGNWPITRPTMLQGPYVPGNYGPLLFSSGIIPVPWTAYPGAPLSPGTSPGTQPAVGADPIYSIAHLSPAATAYSGPYISIATGASSSSQKEVAFPERPGQPECQYYLKNGDCKFGASCKFHHPSEWNSSRNFMLSPMGLPLRPGARICSHYSQNGVCEYGPSCRFDHPMRTPGYSSSASSLTDMPVAPYTIGSTSLTLAPSTFPSDRRPSLLADPFPPQMSSMSSASASVGSIFSKSGPASQMSIQNSDQTNIASDPGISLSQGDDVKTSN